MEVRAEKLKKVNIMSPKMLPPGNYLLSVLYAFACKIVPHKIKK